MIEMCRGRPSKSSLEEKRGLKYGWQGYVNRATSIDQFCTWLAEAFLVREFSMQWISIYVQIVAKNIQHDLEVAYALDACV